MVAPGNVKDALPLPGVVNIEGRAVAVVVFLAQLHAAERVKALRLEQAPLISISKSTRSRAPFLLLATRATEAPTLGHAPSVLPGQRPSGCQVNALS